MRITLVSNSLSCGGAERVLVLLTTAFLKKGHQVNVVTLSKVESDFYKLPDRVNRLALNIVKNSPSPLHALWNNIDRLFVLRSAICSTQPDIVISFLDRVNILTLIALLKTKYPVIATEHCDPSMNYCTSPWKQLRRLSYPHAAKVVSVSKGISQHFEQWLPKTKTAAIYNPFLFPTQAQSITTLPSVDPNKKLIISMGRLTYQKGYDLLLSAFQKVAHRYLDWQLVILGEGELRFELEKLREDLGLSEQVFLPGNISDPFPLLKQAKLFVMASRAEGFPMAHGEAMACGLPVICTDCPSGPREIIRDGVDGILVPNKDVSALATAMERLMSDEGERQRLATCAPEVIERFSMEKIMARWETLFAEVLTEKMTSNR